ncbi:M20/M25/M40 family metallo-hydrolase [Stutzerimonas frequens]|uniref:M20/M25/M40 family metallo-hydrolase n=1 Tax=Stutzerimonas frequens TaxID=2968969 RepID=UPI0020A40A59|nr:M20/M25/M40 family metallo-hydrolase [Stutzerimonas frequens]MDA0424668.1 M20/M25/M40 family metallo-hydrolase [Stutzerimonas frequens]
MGNQEQLALLEELLLARGPAGQEEEVRQVCRRELERCCDAVWQDAADNLVGRIKAVGVAPDEAERQTTRIMAHQDEIAMVVKRIDPDGRLRVAALGGAFPVNFGMCPVDVMGDTGTVAGALSFGTMHGTSESSQSMHVLQGNVQWNDVHVITRYSKAELGELGVRAGTRVVLSRHWRKPFQIRDCIAAHFLDDRAPVVAALVAARRLAARREELHGDVLIVLTTNEEETNSGAQYAARTLPGALCIALEVGPIAAEYDTRLALDPIVLTGDEKGYYTKRVSDGLLRAASRCGYCPQPALMPGFASDASAVLGSGSAPQAGCLAIPTENTHGYEVIMQDAMQACAETLVEYLVSLQ